MMALFSLKNVCDSGITFPPDSLHKILAMMSLSYHNVMMHVEFLSRQASSVLSRQVSSETLVTSPRSAQDLAKQNVHAFLAGPSSLLRQISVSSISQVNAKNAVGINNLSEMDKDAAAVKCQQMSAGIKKSVTDEADRRIDMDESKTTCPHMRDALSLTRHQVIMRPELHGYHVREWGVVHTESVT